MFRLCIIGSGITGAMIAKLLKERLPQLKVIILEKAKGTGGRMCTSRSPFGSSLDLGAQFISRSSCVSETQEKSYSELLEAQLLQPLPEIIEGVKSSSQATDHFVCPKGSGSIVKHFLKLAGCEILFGHRVIKLNISSEKWKITCDNNRTYEVDAIVSTVPVPQVLQMEGIKFHINNENLEKMRAVEYCSRLAVGLYFDSHTTYFENIAWAAKFFEDDTVLCFCSIDYRMRNSVSSLPTLVVHTTKEFGKIYIDNDVPSVQSLILHKLEEVFPNMPKPSYIKFHKWRYSQVETCFSGQPGCLVASKTPLLLCGGDGFSYSTFEGCIYSAESTVKRIIENIH